MKAFAFQFDIKSDYR